MLCSHRINRTCLRDELYATGKMKEEIRGEPCEDDLMLSTRAEAKFVHTCNLEMQCSTPKRTEELREGTTTLMLMHKEEIQGISKQKSFLWLSKMLIQLRSVELSLLKCSKVRNILPIQYHATLGFPINHIVPISKSKQAIFATSIFNFSVLSQLTLIH